MLAPPSRLTLEPGLYHRAFVIVNLRMVSPPSKSALIMGAWLVLQGFEFAGVGSAVEVGFDYRGWPCITGDF